jgi:epoxyqueuosine reductase QueG
VYPFNLKFSEPAAEPGYAAHGPGERPVGVEAPAGEDVAVEPRRARRRQTHPGTEAPPLIELMRMTREEWDLWTRGSAIRRAGYAGFRRNVAAAMGNWLAGVEEPPEEGVAVLRDALEDDEPLVRQHAAWALER